MQKSAQRIVNSNKEVKYYFFKKKIEWQMLKSPESSAGNGCSTSQVELFKA